MAAIEFRIVVYDEETAEKEGRWGDLGFSLAGMTAPQADVIIRYTRAFADRIEKSMPIIKRGYGEILPEPEDQATVTKKASAEEDLVRELLDEGEDED